ncbi:hypothetical protein M0811_09982 [Anaeramoeba ignava]|uniref:Uncharacterized protein n=1 Tax=Anaeramoeba ignava TaxID=1746090 RepID=A0A9Q0LFA0_ANAIG|nr:hypothetical protein M0811_09982 [Anaeramoeba ignava]
MSTDNNSDNNNNNNQSLQKNLNEKSHTNLAEPLLSHSSDNELQIIDIENPPNQNQPQKRIDRINLGNSFNINVRCITVNPKNKYRTIELRDIIRVSPDDDISIISQEFMAAHPEIQTTGYFVLHRSLLFKTGTISSCRIEEGDEVELFNSQDQRAKYSNEGFSCIFWSSLAVMLGLILFITSWSYEFNENISAQGTLAMIGFVILIPSVIILTIGICQTNLCGESSFSGESWC